jgi:hypothetical protein
MTRNPVFASATIQRRLSPLWPIVAYLAPIGEERQLWHFERRVPFELVDRSFYLQPVRSELLRVIHQGFAARSGRAEVAAVEPASRSTVAPARGPTQPENGIEDRLADQARREASPFAFGDELEFRLADGTPKGRGRSPHVV